MNYANNPRTHDYADRPCDFQAHLVPPCDCAITRFNPLSGNDLRPTL